MARLPRIGSLLAAALVLVAAADVRADEEEDHDHERARAALEAGEIAPLREILERAQAEFAGSLLEVELEREGERWLYEIELLAPGGAILELLYDARSKELLGVKGHGLERARRKEDD